MCGIVGYVGASAAAPILVEGLRRLEYRGYDSAGLAVHDGQRIDIVRALGKLRRLGEALDAHPLPGTVGIGHTRWATHGRPSEENAHPHVAGPVAVVHNGIIENHVALRQELVATGVTFSSDTDTEIIAHLIERALDGSSDLLRAVRSALTRVSGAYAIAVVSEAHPDVIVAARQGSPLVLGRGEGEMLCGSDIAALLSHTRDMVFLEDGDVAELSLEGLRIETVAGDSVVRPPKRIDWSPVMAERGGYKHFMLKEIHEQPDAVAETLRGRLDLEAGDVYAQEIGVRPDVARDIKRVYVVACGTSFHAAMTARYWLEAIARVPTVVELGSEVRYRKPLFFPEDLVVAVSQSGETYDTIGAVHAAREAGATVLAIANVLDSAIPRLAHGSLYTRAGPEIGVASTKCFTAQLAALFMLAVYLGRRRGALDEERGRELLQALCEVPSHMHDLLGDADYVRSVATKLVHATDVLYLGRGLSFPIALEGALKLKEISYAHAEGYAAGEMKHGPIALIDTDLPVVVICPKDGNYEKTVSNIQEVRAREGDVVAIATKGDEAMHDVAQHILWIPAAAEVVLPLLTVVPLQLLAYYVAARKGHDVDQPRNLAKTVTVE
ncbi:MAG: glutamine--fructose-6-phosphate transaminase (isomerizing) [Deltaproteobacteria bacterium]|jgi:glucosamine--fructose-6-phosphate aminotransferase (isomerizing)|nr:glutamine--fructose-6-phosphate transaminase (isomerizing) [Deltaproteobacteria bacterium]MBW2534433.1 glutamine--fructose-6-phosphate transaminase (isomerizing) [Deltaproteobacteria bacterium]